MAVEALAAHKSETPFISTAVGIAPDSANLPCNDSYLPRMDRAIWVQLIE
jgi:hypothetical protein